MSASSVAGVRQNAPRARTIRRTWPQRMVIVLNLGVALASLAGAVVLNYGRAPATPITRPAVETIPSLAPSTAARRAFSRRAWDPALASAA